MKTLYILILSALFTCAVQTETNAANSQRAGLYNRTKVEKTSTSSENNGLYAPLRTTGNLLQTIEERPEIEEGIGTDAPIGGIPYFILLTASTAYIGFVFFRKLKVMHLSRLRR